MAPDMKIRVPDALKKQIRRAASASGRSLNSEIIFRLQASFAADDDRSKAAAAKLLRIGMPDDDVEARLTALEARMADLEIDRKDRPKR